MYDARLDAKLDRFGIWQFGDAQGAGRITYEPSSGLVLEFTASDRAVELHFGGRRGPFTITGRLAPPNAELVTLEDCYLTGRVENYHDATATFRVGRALFGAADAGVTTSVSELWCDMTALDEWATPALPFMDVVELTDGRSGYSVATTTALPAVDIEFERAMVKLRTSIDRSYGNLHASFKQATSFSIHLSEPTRLDEVLAAYVRPLENFISLGTGKTNSVRSVWIRSGNAHAKPVAILFRPVQARSQRADWLVWPTGLFSLLDVEDRAAELITAWMSVYSKYRTVCDQLFYTIYNRQYLESYFLSLVQTLEGLHRVHPSFRQARRGSDEYAALKRVILAAVPIEDRKFVAELLQHGNSVSLRERLEDFSRSFGGLVSGILAPEERETFPRRCARIRNAMSHHLPDNQNIDPGEMHRYADFVLRLIVACLLTDIGFQPLAVHHALQRGASVVREQRFGA